MIRQPISRRDRQEKLRHPRNVARRCAHADAPHTVHSLAFSPDGKLLAATDGKKAVQLWKVD